MIPLKQLAAYLRRRKHAIVSTVEFQAQRHDPTYGLVESNVTIEVVDFDALLDEIDAFADTFNPSERSHD